MHFMFVNPLVGLGNGGGDEKVTRPILIARCTIACYADLEYCILHAQTLPSEELRRKTAKHQMLVPSILLSRRPSIAGTRGR